MNALRQQLEFIFNGGAVKRYHTVNTIHTQTDADHSFGVAWLVWMLTEGRASAKLLMAALAHDLAEHVTGDVPSQTKRVADIGAKMAGLEAIHRGAAGVEFYLTEEEERVLDLADNLEGMMFCVAERRMGNRNAELWYLRFLDYALSVQAVTPNVPEVLNVIQNLWREACQSMNDK